MEKLNSALIAVLTNIIERRTLSKTSKPHHTVRIRKYIAAMVGGGIAHDIYKSEFLKWNMDIVIPACSLHDIGKILISDVILLKPGKLSVDEFNIIRKHTEYGEKIIDEISDETEDLSQEALAFITMAKKFIGEHHERWDGQGYPKNLKGNEISLEGRVMAIADVYDVLRREKPYKRAHTHSQTMDIINSDSGSHFDPKMIEILNYVEKDFEKV
ncbi:MAG: HD domain-containing protein [Ruminococcus sp.]|nr:HD domain-containing protein [Ruminococcus sp.]